MESGETIRFRKLSIILGEEGILVGSEVVYLKIKIRNLRFQIWNNSIVKLFLNLRKNTDFPEVITRKII